MAITFGVKTADTTLTGPGFAGNGDFTVPLPTGWTVGELAILLVYHDAGSGTVPTGWAQVSGSPWGSATPKLQAFWKILVTSEPDPMTTISGDSGTLAHCAGIMTFAGVHTTTPVEAVGAATSSTGTPMTAAATTTVSDGAWALGLCGRGDNEVAGSQTFGGSATGVTERLDAGSNVDDDSQVSAYSKEITTGGTTTGAGSATTSATDPYVSVIIVLKPAPANHALTADGIAATPALASPVLAQIHALSTVAITATPSLATPALSQAHALTATGITTTPALEAPAVIQTHFLGASGLTTGPPGLDEVTLLILSAKAEWHFQFPNIIWQNLVSVANVALTANGITASPEMGTPAISQTHALTAAGITTTPSVGTPTVSQNHTLSAAGISTTPALGTPAISQNHALGAALLTATPALGAPAVTQGHVLTASGIATESPALATPTISQTHNLSASDLATGSPDLGQPALAETSTFAEWFYPHFGIVNWQGQTANSSANDALTANGLTVGAIALGTPAITQTHALASAELTTAPALGTPVIAQGHSLSATGISAGAPTLGTPVLNQICAFTADGIAAGLPTLGTPQLAQIHALVAAGIITGAPTLGTPILDVSLTADGILVGAPILGTPVLAQAVLFAEQILLNGAFQRSKLLAGSFGARSLDCHGTFDHELEIAGLFSKSATSHGEFQRTVELTGRLN